MPAMPGTEYGGAGSGVLNGRFRRCRQCPQGRGLVYLNLVARAAGRDRRAAAMVGAPLEGWWRNVLRGREGGDPWPSGPSSTGRRPASSNRPSGQPVGRRFTEITAGSPHRSPSIQTTPERTDPCPSGRAWPAGARTTSRCDHSIKRWLAGRRPCTRPANATPELVSRPRDGHPRPRTRASRPVST